MARITLVALCMMMTGCASTPFTNMVYSKVHVGSTAKDLETSLGRPEKVEPSVREPNATAVYYFRGDESCGFTMSQADVVMHMKCVQAPSRSNSGGGAFLANVLMAVPQQQTSWGESYQAQQAPQYKQTDYACMTRCQNRGSAYGFCKSQCEY